MSLVQSVIIGEITVVFWSWYPTLIHILCTLWWDMSVEEDQYTLRRARTLNEMQELASKCYSSCSKHLGCIKIPLNHILLDELHLLRIGDVLLRNLILYSDGVDHRNMAHRGERTHTLQKLEDAIRSCGFNFHIWQN